MALPVRTVSFEAPGLDHPDRLAAQRLASAHELPALPVEEEEGEPVRLARQHPAGLVVEPLKVRAVQAGRGGERF